MNDARLRLLWVLTAAVALTAAGLCLLVGAEPGPGHRDLPWWALAAAFAVTELCVVHVHFRRSAHSLTLGEIPLVLGLLFASTSEVMLAWALGAAIVLVATRTPAVRLVFNLALLALTAAVAGAVLHGLVGPEDGLGPATWAAAALGAVASSAVGAGLIGVAVRLSEGRLGAGRLAQMLGTAGSVAAANTGLALSAAVVLDGDPRAAALLLVPVATVFAAYRGYLAERARHTNLAFLYETARALTRAPDPSSALVAVLSRAQATFRGEVAQACLFEGPSCTTLGPGDRVGVDEAADADAAAALGALVADRPARLLRRDDAPPALAAHLDRLGIREAMIAALTGELGASGALLVGERAGVGGHFRRDELKLLETLARHTGAALEHGRLGRQVEELRALQAQLEHQAFHDPLTGLANRLLFHDRVRHALARREGTAAVMYIDLDDFKCVNDTLGHDAGDALLTTVADRLRTTLRGADTPARLGGDEFAVLLLDISEENARTVAGRILEALAEPVRLGGTERPIGASLGLALGAAGSVDADGLLRRADAAMYAAKHGGKGHFAVYGAAAVAVAA